MDFKTSIYAKTRSRRSHTKSRRGCANCKKRRIKCDEAEPECTNCIRHFIKCNYGSVTQRASSTPSTPRNTVAPGSSEQHIDVNGYTFISASTSGFTVPRRAHGGATATSSLMQQSPSTHPETAMARPPFKFTATDMVLFHHCLSSDDLRPYIPDQLLRLGFSVHYVLHLLLAVSGFHLKRMSPQYGVHLLLLPDLDYLVEAERHLSIAVTEVAATDPHLHQDNCHILYVASVFIFICSLARGPQPREYLAFRDDDDTPGLCLFTGMRSIREASNNLGISTNISEVHPHEGPGTSRSSQEELVPVPNSSPSVSTEYKGCSTKHYSEPLNSLKVFILDTFPSSHPRHSTYLDVFDLLQSRYNSIHGGPASIENSELWPQIFSWLYLLPDAFVHEMQQKQPVALLLFSYFAVLLKELDFVWFIRGWPLHIVQGSARYLEQPHLSYLEWPLDRLRSTGSPQSN